MLRKFLLDFERQKHFFELTQEAAFKRKRDVTCKLHGDCARSAKSVVVEPCHAGRQLNEVIDQRNVINPTVLVKALVFSIQNSADEGVRHILYGDGNQAAFAKFTNQFAIACIYAQRCF